MCVCVCVGVGASSINFCIVVFVFLAQNVAFAESSGKPGFRVTSTPIWSALCGRLPVFPKGNHVD